VYDPASNMWSATGQLGAPRVDHVAVRLIGGRTNMIVVDVDNLHVSAGYRIVVGGFLDGFATGSAIDGGRDGEHHAAGQAAGDASEQPGGQRGGERGRVCGGHMRRLHVVAMSRLVTC
jgi:hypothetical protein